MKTIVMFMMLGAASAAWSPAAAADRPQTTKYYVDVQGHLAPVSGALEAKLTFSAPVQVPRKELPAGTYIFRMLNPTTMTVLSEDRMKTYATFSTTPTVRRHDLRRAQLRFERMSADEPPRLIGLYVDGSATGYQPLYPKLRRNASAPVATSGVK